MGLQQILMIVLSIIIVGIAVAVGIIIFDTQATNQKVAAIHSDLQQLAIHIQAYWRTPVIMGGAGFNMASASVSSIVTWFDINEDNPYIKTPNGSYGLSVYSIGDPFMHIDLVSEPPVKGWIAKAVVFYDGRSNMAQGIDNGIWTYIGPESGAPSPPTE